jgi:hypothetical protein
LLLQWKTKNITNKKVPLVDLPFEKVRDSVDQLIAKIDENIDALSKKDEHRDTGFDQERKSFFQEFVEKRRREEGVEPSKRKPVPEGAPKEQGKKEAEQPLTALESAKKQGQFIIESSKEIGRRTLFGGGDKEKAAENQKSIHETSKKLDKHRS